MPTTLLRHVAHIAQVAAMAFVLTFSVDARADAQKRGAAPATSVAHESKPKPGAAHAPARAANAKAANAKAAKAKAPTKAKASKLRLAKATAAPHPSANTKNAKHTPKHEPKPRKDRGNAAPRARLTAPLSA